MSRGCDSPPARRWSGLFARAALLLALWVAAPVAAQPVAGPAERLVLAVTLDGVGPEEPVTVSRRGPALIMRAADLRALGLSVPAGATEVALDQVPGVRWSVDAGTQTLELHRLTPVRQHLSATRAADGPALSASGWGGVLNYDLAATRAGGGTAVGGLFDAVVYGPRGHAFAGVAVTSAPGPGGRHLTRLDTGVTVADARALRRTTIGDVVTGTTGQARAVRLLGVQHATDFALRPDLVTFPVPTIDGSAAVPSSVDLLVNGARAPAGDVRAGEFSVADVPVRAGVNTVAVAVRDALGRETQRTLTVYASPALLRPGLRALSVEAGLVRRGYGTAADRYGAPVASGSWRLGVSDRLTVEAHGEAGRRVGTGAAGLAWSLGPLGLVSAEAGVSGGGGTRWSIGVERVAHPVSLTARWSATSRGWRDLASEGGAITRGHLATLSLGFDLGRLGSVGATAVEAGKGWIGRSPRVDPTLPRSGLAALNWSLRLWRGAGFNAAAGADWRQRGTWFASAGLLVSLGPRASGYAGVDGRPGGAGGVAQVTRPALLPGEVGFRAGLATGTIERVAAAVERQGAAGHLEAAVESVDGQVAARLAARGAVVLADGALLAAERLDDSFALVRTGRPGVPIYRDGNRVGRTDRGGRLVVAHLRAFERTRLSIDPLELDDEVLARSDEQVVVPGERAGVPVRFAIAPAAARLLHLVEAGGASLGAGTAATLADGTLLPIGFDGAVYLTGPPTPATLSVDLPDAGMCVVEVPAGPPPPVLTCRRPLVARR